MIFIVLKIAIKGSYGALCLSVIFEFLTVDCMHVLIKPFWRKEVLTILLVSVRSPVFFLVSFGVLNIYPLSRY